jgi:hypothetical protein
MPPRYSAETDRLLVTAISTSIVLGGMICASVPGGCDQRREQSRYCICAASSPAAARRRPPRCRHCPIPTSPRAMVAAMTATMQQAARDPSDRAIDGKVHDAPRKPARLHQHARSAGRTLIAMSVKLFSPWKKLMRDQHQRQLGHDDDGDQRGQAEDEGDRNADQDERRRIRRRARSRRPPPPRRRGTGRCQCSITCSTISMRRAATVADRHREMKIQVHMRNCSMTGDICRTLAGFNVSTTPP